MRSWTDTTARPWWAGPAAPARGILHPQQVGPVFALDRLACAPGLDPYVEHHWTVAWDLPAARTQPSDVLAHPSVHLTVEEGDGPRHGVALPAVLVHGVPTRRFEVELRGAGRVTGVKFRPGGFTALTGRPAHPFTDRVVPATDVWPHARDLLDAVLAEHDDASRCRLLDAFLLDAVPAPDPRFATVRAVVDAVLTDRTLTRVDAVAAAHGLSVRTLQRLMRDHVGVSATWLVRRFRLHDAVADLQADPRLDLAELAVRLGWYDQAHLTRDFTRAVGVSPARYARALRDAAATLDGPGPGP